MPLFSRLAVELGHLISPSPALTWALHQQLLFSGLQTGAESHHQLADSRQVTGLLGLRDLVHQRLIVETGIGVDTDT